MHKKFANYEILALASAFAMGLTACGDDSSTNPAESSSSIESSSSAESSSSSATSFETGSMTDSRDGRSYKTVTIGEQTWMAENLNFAYNEPTSTLDSSSFCYDNENENCEKFGRLYLWSAAMDSAAVLNADGKGCGAGVTCDAAESVHGVCPEGWRLPQVKDWNILIAAVGNMFTAGADLKSAEGWEEGAGRDSYGFTALPAGYRHFGGTFGSMGEYAYFWTSEEYVVDHANYQSFEYNKNDAVGSMSGKNNAYSVRCIKE